MQPPQGIDRERRARNVRVGERHAEPLVSVHGEAAQLHAVSHAGLDLDALMRRLVDRHEQDAIEAELPQCLGRAHQVADVRRVERPAEQPDPGH
jgi:hypothetical protein